MLVAEASAAVDTVHASTDAVAGMHEAGAALHSKVFPPFDPSSFGAQLIWLTLTFVILYFAMSRLALPRIASIIELRKARIDGDLSAADAARQKTDAAITSYEAAVAAARAKSQAIAEETRNAIKADIDAKRKSVEADLFKTIADAEANIQAAKSAAIYHVSEIAADTVKALVTQLTGSATHDEALKAVTTVTKE